MHSWNDSGIYLKRKWQKNLIISLVLFLIGFIIFYEATVMGGKWDNWDYIKFYSSLIFFASFTFFGRSSNYRKGAKGENAVKNALSKLSNEYTLYNDINFPDRSGNIDHILLGSNGIFVIETKNWSGDVSCNDDEWSINHKRLSRSPSKQVTRNVMRVKDILNKDIWIDGIIVFTNNRMKGLNRNHKTVSILKLDELYDHILQNRQILSPQEREVLGYRIMSNSIV